MGGTMSNTVTRYKVVSECKQPREGTNKRVILTWCKEQVDGFTRDEFLKYVLEANGSGELPKPSVMKDTVFPKAWWNEFFNKQELIEQVTE